MALKNIFAFKKEDTQHLTPEEQQEVKFVEDFYTNGVNRRRAYEKQWYFNMAFFLGHQWVVWNKTKNSLEKPVVPSWRVRLTANKIMPTVLHSVARMTQSRPNYVVIPGTTDDEAVNAAEVSRKALEYIHRISQMDMLNQRLILWMIVYGTAFKDPYFDTTAGIRKSEPKTTTQINPETGESEEIPIIGNDDQPEMYDIATGEIDTDILSPFSVIPEAGATNLEKSFRVMKVVSASLEWIRNAYPENGKYVKAEVDSNVSSMEKQLQHLMGEQFQNEKIEEKDKKSEHGYATIKELREKPSKKHPNGRCIRVANGVLLESGDLPYKYMIKRNTLGMVKYDYIALGERFWGKSPVEDMIPLQIDRNKSLSQIIENRNMMSKPKWIVHVQSRVSKTAITSEPGEVIQHSTPAGVAEPHPVTPPSMPNYVFNLLDVGGGDLDDVGLIARVSRGEAPPGVSSGIAINYLQEKDNSVFGPFMTRFECKEGIAGTYTLEIAKEKYREPRILKIIGQNNEIEVLDFEATEDMPTDVWVQSGSSLPSSLVAKQNLILEYAKGGLFGDITDDKTRMRALRLAEIGGIDTLYEENAIDEREAKRENRLFEHGEKCDVNVFDNHAMHIYYHDFWRKSDRYRQLVKENPNVATYAEAHITFHMQKDPQAQAQAAMAAQQEAMIKAQQEQAKVSTENAQAQATSKMIDDVRRREIEDKQAVTPGKGRGKNAT
jgi:hypothetical protein